MSILRGLETTIARWARMSRMIAGVSSKGIVLRLYTAWHSSPNFAIKCRALRSFSLALSMTFLLKVPFFDAGARCTVHINVAGLSRVDACHWTELEHDTAIKELERENDPTIEENGVEGCCA